MQLPVSIHFNGIPQIDPNLASALNQLWSQLRKFSDNIGGDNLSPNIAGTGLNITNINTPNGPIFQLVNTLAGPTGGGGGGGAGGGGGYFTPKTDGVNPTSIGMEVAVKATDASYGRFCVIDSQDSVSPPRQIMSLVPDPSANTNPGGMLLTPLGATTLNTGGAFDIIFQRNSVEQGRFNANALVLSTPLAGSTSASGTLTIESTTNATKGKILFGTSAYDEVNNRLGVGTASPGTPVDVVGNIRTSTQLVSTQATGTAPAVVSSTTLVTNLNSDYLNGAHASATPTASTIPIADGSGKLASGWVSEVLALTDLSDVSAKTGSGTTVVMNDGPTFVTGITTPVVTIPAGGGGVTHIVGPSDQPLVLKGGAAQDLSLKAGSSSGLVKLINPSGSTILQVNTTASMNFNGNVTFGTGLGSSVKHLNGPTDADFTLAGSQPTSGGVGNNTNVRAGQGNGANNGGNLQLAGGQAGAAAQTGGNIVFQSTLAGSGNGALITILTLNNTGQFQWPTGLGAITHISGPTDQNLKLAASAPAGSANGNNLTLLASAATTAGNGGNISITAGAAAGSSGTGGAIVEASGAGVNGTAGTNAGGWSWTSGAPGTGTTGAGGTAGQFSIVPIAGGATSAGTADGGTGSSYTITTGAGGNSFGGNGGLPGDISHTLGNAGTGGNTRGATYTVTLGTRTGTGTQGYMQFAANDGTNLMKMSNDGILTLGASGANLKIIDKIKTYNNITTAGWGVPAIYATNRQTGLTAAVSATTIYTVSSSDGTFIVSTNVNVTAIAVGIKSQLIYTDETNTAQTLTFNLSNVTGTLGLTAAAVGAYEGIPLHIRCKASTVIQIQSAYTSGTYNIEWIIQQIA